MKKIPLDDPDYIDWCKDGEIDPSDPESMDSYEESQAEQGQQAWDSMTPEDREGYESMMTD